MKADQVAIAVGAGLLLVAGVGGVGVLFLDDQPRRSVSRTAAAEPGNEEASSTPGRTPTKTDGPATGGDDRVARPPGSARKPGGATGGRRSNKPQWVPASSKESIDAAQIPTKVVTDAQCKQPVTLLGTAKGIAVGFERELRKATRISDAEESKLGVRIETAVGGSRRFKGKWDPPRAVAKYGAYISKLVFHLARQGKRKAIRYRVHIVQDSSFNAFAMPGGVLAVHTGVLDGPNAVKDEAELAAILGHEIAHIELRHAVAAYQYAKVVLGPGADIGQIVTRMLTLPISSKYEEAADALGGRVAVFSGYNPVAASRLWRRLATREKASGLNLPLDDVLGSPEELLRSHPPARERCFLALKTAVGLRPKLLGVRLYNGPTSLRKREPGFEVAY